MNLIEQLARKHGTGGWQTLDDMVRFGEAVAAAEREACAKWLDFYDGTEKRRAEAIRNGDHHAL